MVTSNYMPDVEVHIAFDSGYNTPAASRTWTDVSDYVELADRIAIAFGRQDERSTAGANTLTLALDNSDGRFTAGHGGSPYSPNVKLGRPIRVRVTPPGGTTVERFVGFVDEWPVEWNNTSAYAAARIRASSRLARLGLSSSLKSTVEEEILADGPSAYFTLGDPSGSTVASESSGAGAAPMRVVGAGAAVTFGSATGPGTDELPAVTLAGGQYLQGSTVASSGSAQSVSCFMLRSGAPAVRELLLATFSAASTPGIMLQILTSGAVEARSGSAIQLIGSVNVCDGETHHVAVTRSGATWTLYVDGAADATTAAGSATAITSRTPLVGGPASDPTDPVPVTVFTGTVAHAAFWTTSTLTAARVLAHAQAGLTGFAGERTDERVTRLLEWAGVPDTEVDAETGDATMTYQKTTGQSVVDALRECESTEGGVLFDGPDGNVHFHNRSHRYLATAAATLDGPSDHVGADYAPKLDRSTLVNDATIENPTTGESARVVDSASRDEYGVAAASARVVADSSDPLAQAAAWLVASYAEPRSRVPSLTVNVLAHQGATPSAQTLLGVTLGDVLAVTTLPDQAPDGYASWDLGEAALGGGTTLGDGVASYFVEGYTETIGPESYEISFNLSPTSPFLDTLVLDSADRGVLDSDNVLAY